MSLVPTIGLGVGPVGVQTRDGREKRKRVTKSGEMDELKRTKKCSCRGNATAVVASRVDSYGPGWCADVGVSRRVNPCLFAVWVRGGNAGRRCAQMRAERNRSNVKCY